MEKTKIISRRKFLTVCAAMLLASLSISQAGGMAAAQARLSGDKKMLVVYYSWGGNTRYMAEQIQSLTGADIFELQTVNPYPKEYRPTTEQAKRELETGYRPQLSSKPEKLDDYDIIFIGSPNWWATLAMPFFTFLEEHNLAGKTIVPFMTHEGSGFGRSLADLKSLCPDAVMLEGLAVRGGRVRNAQAEIERWLAKIEIEIKK